MLDIDTEKTLEENSNECMGFSGRAALFVLCLITMDKLRFLRCCIINGENDLGGKLKMFVEDRNRDGSFCSNEQDETKTCEHFLRREDDRQR